jgi:hypothetical protein
MSISTRDNASRVSLESAELVYKQLACEGDLFTARVYKRNYRPAVMKRLLKPEREIQPSRSGSPATRPVTPRVGGDQGSSSIQPTRLAHRKLESVTIVTLGDPGIGQTQLAIQVSSRVPKHTLS